MNAELWRAAGEDWGQLDVLLAAQPYLAGERLTMADIPAGTLAYRYFTLPLERPALPRVEAWFARLSETGPPTRAASWSPTTTCSAAWPTRP